MSKLLIYEKMVEETKYFYKSFGIENIPKERIKDAVASITLPNYAKEHNDKFHNDLNDHRALATVGDAVCTKILMIEKYHYDSTAERLTEEKDFVTNNNLNKIGERLLKDKLFSRNNDLDDNNTKSYATAFEAVIGFIAIIDINKADEIFKQIIDEKCE